MNSPTEDNTLANDNSSDSVVEGHYSLSGRILDTELCDIINSLIGRTDANANEDIRTLLDACRKLRFGIIQTENTDALRQALTTMLYASTLGDALSLPKFEVTPENSTYFTELEGEVGSKALGAKYPEGGVGMMTHCTPSHRTMLSNIRLMQLHIWNAHKLSLPVLQSTIEKSSRHLFKVPESRVDTVCWMDGFDDIPRSFAGGGSQEFASVQDFAVNATWLPAAKFLSMGLSSKTSNRPTSMMSMLGHPEVRDIIFEATGLDVSELAVVVEDHMTKGAMEVLPSAMGCTFYPVGSGAYHQLTPVPLAADVAQMNQSIWEVRKAKRGIKAGILHYGGTNAQNSGSVSSSMGGNLPYLKVEFPARLNGNQAFFHAIAHGNARFSRVPPDVVGKLRRSVVKMVTTHETGLRARESLAGRVRSFTIHLLAGAIAFMEEMDGDMAATLRDCSALSSVGRAILLRHGGERLTEVAPSLWKDFRDNLAGYSIHLDDTTENLVRTAMLDTANEVLS